MNKVLYRCEYKDAILTNQRLARSLTFAILKILFERQHKSPDTFGSLLSP
jgi:hypothetical protein